MTVLPASPDLAGPASGKTCLGHPRGLATLFLTEMWERFSFYGMTALLVFYLISGGAAGAAAHLPGGGLGTSLATATAVYSVYSALVYLMTMPGGWIADRVWGARRTVAVGGAVITAGHFVLALPGMGGLMAGLALVAVGSGLLKANISAMVGHLYRDGDDARRNGGFTIFYLGINIGGLAAPLIVGTVGETVSWRLAFVISGVGMGLGLVQFLLGARHLSPEGDRVPHPLTRGERRTVGRRSLAVAVAAAAFYGAVVATGHYTLTWAMLPLTIAGLVIPVLVMVRMRRDRGLSRAERSRLGGYVWLFIGAAVFWMIYDQGGSTVLAFAKTNTAGQVAGFSVPGSWYQSLNPLFILALAPVFAWLWIRLAHRRREPSDPVKFSLGMIAIGASLLLFLPALAMASGGHKVTPLWLVAIYLVQTLGELTLSPVGLSATTRLAPQRYGSQMLGVWFLAVTAGDSVTGMLAMAHVDLSGFAAVAGEAAVALLAGLAIHRFRGRVNRLLAGTA
ncbi:peptide MFS transporter [Streptomyces sp. NPDC059104]|uniref:peptide MFS transporter n=1 Tax=Streptomyces sp. NPDC059104 TaxID=3346729 RepID=UPI003680D08F